MNPPTNRIAIADHLNPSLVFGGVRVAQYLKFFCFCFVLSYYVSLHSEFPVVMSAAAISAYNRCSTRLPFVCRRVHVLFTLFVFVCVLCFVFAFFTIFQSTTLKINILIDFIIIKSSWAKTDLMCCSICRLSGAYYKSLFVLFVLAIVLSVCLQFTTFSYHFVIFKLFLSPENRAIYQRSF
jgi:hypothetical protein